MNNEKCGVYFILNKDNNLIKIGCSNNIQRRYNELVSNLYNLGLNNELEILKTIETKNKFEVENIYHSIFKEYRKTGEWFDITLDMINNVDYLKEIKDKNINAKIFFKNVNNNSYNIINGKCIPKYNINNISKVNLDMQSKGVFYSFLELEIDSKDNIVTMKGNIPLYEDIAEYIGMSERNLRRYLSVLEEKNLIKITTFGFRKAIVINPEYYATGKDLDIETLKLFNILECDDEKINSYV